MCGKTLLKVEFWTENHKTLLLVLFCGIRVKATKAFLFHATEVAKGRPYCIEYYFCLLYVLVAIFSTPLSITRAAGTVCVQYATLYHPAIANCSCRYIKCIQIPISLYWIRFATRFSQVPRLLANMLCYPGYAYSTVRSRALCCAVLSCVCTRERLFRRLPVRWLSETKQSGNTSSLNAK